MSINFSNDNLLLFGDNLKWLDLLEKNYKEKVKCIYIDPPYNNKKPLIHYKDNLNHVSWIEMMKSRIIKMHNLLRKDGTIWISIDDNECHYLKILCDEIFERKNFISSVIWQRKCSPANDSKWLSKNHDHILVYAKNKNIKDWDKENSRGLNFLPRTEKMNSRYKNPDNDPRGDWVETGLSVGRPPTKKNYPIQAPSGQVHLPSPGRSWRLSKQSFQKLKDAGLISFGKTGENIPAKKTFLSEVQDGYVSSTIWLKTEVGGNSEAKKELLKINKDDVFQTPKPELLIKKILDLATKPGDIVLDCFAGSGTTGAVAHKMDRKWIMIEIGEHLNTHIIPRINNVIKGKDLGGITKQVGWKGGGTFSLLKN